MRQVHCNPQGFNIHVLSCKVNNNILSAFSSVNNYKLFKYGNENDKVYRNISFNDNSILILKAIQYILLAC